MEWLILDDGTDKVKDLFDASGLTYVRYYSEDSKQNIGVKRNKLNELAKGEIVVCMDDDDFYPPERVSHAVTKLAGQKGANRYNGNHIVTLVTLPPCCKTRFLQPPACPV